MLVAEGGLDRYNPAHRGVFLSQRDDRGAHLPHGDLAAQWGGSGHGGTTNGASRSELYDGTWTANSSPMNTLRYYGHTATMLPNGRVLVAGGYGSSGPLSAAELCMRPAGIGNTQYNAGPMNVAREGDTATMLPNGTVLVAGGHNSSSYYLSSAEYYDVVGLDSWWLKMGSDDRRARKSYGDLAA